MLGHSVESTVAPCQGPLTVRYLSFTGSTKSDDRARFGGVGLLEFRLSGRSSGGSSPSRSSTTADAWSGLEVHRRGRRSCCPTQRGDDLRVAEILDRIVKVQVAQIVGVTGCEVEEPLQSLRFLLAHVLGDRPPVLTFNRRQQAFKILPRM